MARGGALTRRQARFVEEYLIDLNATQAAVRAGFSPRSAAEIGSRLIEKSQVADAIARATAERSARVGLRQDRVLEELSVIGFAKLTDFAEWDGERFRLKPSAEIDGRAVVQVMETEKFIKTVGDGEVLMSRERSIKLHDKVAALNLLAKHLSLYPERAQAAIQNNVVVVAQPIEYAREFTALAPADGDGD
jgi:phage terminase small subunit